MIVLVAAVLVIIMMTNTTTINKTNGTKLNLLPKSFPFDHIFRK
jgi:hypothetical protein